MLIDNIFNKVWERIQSESYKGWDPYDILNSDLFSHKSYKSRSLLFLTQLNRISPINFRPILEIQKVHNSKAMALILSALLNSKSQGIDTEVDFIKNWLVNNKSRSYDEYSIGFTFAIILRSYSLQKKTASLIITLFVMYSFIEYYNKTEDKLILNEIFSFGRLINQNLPKCENSSSLWYSYNFHKLSEIYNATAKIGKFYSLLYNITNDDSLVSKIAKILNYLCIKQRDDGSWAYGENISYSDGFHTAFVLEAIWYMRKVVDKKRYETMFDQGLEHYKLYFFKPHGQPLYFHPTYKPRDIRRYLIKTDIRDCAMAIVLFSKIGDYHKAYEVLNWTIKNMYNSSKGYFYYYKNKLWTNKIEFIRWQAWMLYALSVLNREERLNTQ